MKEIRNFIAGKWTAAKSGETLDVFDPATGAVYAQAANSDIVDMDAAVSAATEAFPTWSETTTERRANFLRSIAKAIEKRQGEFVRAECIDTGKPLGVAAAVDIPRSIVNFKFFADAAGQFASDFHQKDSSSFNYTLRKPLGVVGCISPWNLPLYLLSWKIAPALAAGNTVVAKPSEITPMTAALLGEVCEEVGLPKGVLNIVHGLGQTAGATLTQNEKVKAISFTGSTQTGSGIAATCAPSFRKVSLEMGGKNANIIFADCDFDQAVQQSVRAAFSNQGQICLCGSRILIEKNIYEKFKHALVDQTKALVVGDPLDEQTTLGAVVSQNHFDKIMSYIQLAKEEGGKILTGGSAVKLNGRCEKGWFIQPTLIEGLSPTCRVNQEEIFGPVATLIPFENETEALTFANSTPYGLSASVWTNDLKRAHRFSARLETGIVWVNTWMNRDLRTPFGGVKNSGLGREGGFEALRFFTEPQNICIQL